MMLTMVIRVKSPSLRFPTNNMYTLAVFTEFVISISDVSAVVVEKAGV